MTFTLIIYSNFFDRAFTLIADLILRILPGDKNEKLAFSYYRSGMSAQSRGRYDEALENYFEALQLEEDPYDRSYILYNIGLIYGNWGSNKIALEFYHEALVLNENLPQALYNIGIIYHAQAMRTYGHNADEYDEVARELYFKAEVYWKRALKLAPDNYPGARNWLKATGRLTEDDGI